MGWSTRVADPAGDNTVCVFTVSEVMTRDVISASPQTTFKEAVRLLEDHRISGLPVVDRSGKLVGVVSEADLLNKVEKREPDAYVLESRRHRLDRSRASALDVASAMSRDVVSVRPDAPIALAAREMHARGFKRLPVVDAEGRLVGIVSRGDLLKVFLRSDEELAAEIRKILDHAQLEFDGSTLSASVTGGVIELAGKLKSKNQVDATVRAVAGVDGVIGIYSRLTYENDNVEFISLSLERRE
jgi:CBS-domain-containing membrane protein